MHFIEALRIASSRIVSANRLVSDQGTSYQFESGRDSYSYRDRAWRPISRHSNASRRCKSSRCLAERFPSHHIKAGQLFRAVLVSSAQIGSHRVGYSCRIDSGQSASFLVESEHFGGSSRFRSSRLMISTVHVDSSIHATSIRINSMRVGSACQVRTARASSNRVGGSTHAVSIRIDSVQVEPVQLIDSSRIGSSRITSHRRAVSSHFVSVQDTSVGSDRVGDSSRLGSTRISSSRLA